MSGQQIGSTIGLVVGSYFGGPVGGAIGSAIGGAIGGWIDPTKVTGPHTADGGRQTATDGQPIPWVMGAGWVTGTIVQASERRDKKVKDSGKGSGEVVSHYEAHQDFAILICESDINRNSRIAGVLMVEQDGKIVYDVRAGSPILSDSNKWVQGVDFLYGDETQLPHPTLEAITGAGNTCAYRGCAIAVFKDFNITKAGGRIPTFRFLVGGTSYAKLPAQGDWRWLNTSLTDTTHYWDVSYDDSSWRTGDAPFGNTFNQPSAGTNAHNFDNQLAAVIGTFTPLNTRTVIRKYLYLGAVPPSGYHMRGWLDNSYKLYVNGVLTAQNTIGVNGPVDLNISSSSFVVGLNIICILCDDDVATGPTDVSYFDFYLEPLDSEVNEPAIALSYVVSNLMTRGGLSESDLELSAFDTTMIKGFPIAKQMSATDAASPLLGCYFGYMSEWDARLRGAFMGADAVVTFDPGDLLEATGEDDSAIQSTMRAQAVDFPKIMVGTYFDPAQNYMPVTVMRSRPAAVVKATGTSNFDIPVAMAANDAIQAVDKGMKVSYAQLEGTVEFSAPFGGTGGAYIALCPGDPFFLKGRRYMIQQIMMSNGSLDFQGVYDRQSAFTSNVQAIPGNAPSVPSSPYSGATQIMAMNLPSLRPQDTYGLYLAASSPTGSVNWRGCAVEISFDSQATWQAATSINEASVMGTLVANQVAIGGSMSVQVNGDLENATTDQLAANGNAWCIIADSGTADLGQFSTAVEDPSTAGLYVISGVVQGQRGTAAAVHSMGQAIAMLDSVYFLPIDTQFAGKTLFLRATGYGETVDDATVISVVYNPDTSVIYDAGSVTP